MTSQRELWMKYYAPLFSLDCLLSIFPCSIFAGDTDLGECCLPQSCHPSCHWGEERGQLCSLSCSCILPRCLTQLQTFWIPVFQSNIFWPLMQGITNSSLHFCLKFSKCFTRCRTRVIKQKQAPCSKCNLNAGLGWEYFAMAECSPLSSAPRR